MFFIKSFVLFIRNSAGSINNPYSTFRTLSLKTGNFWQIIYIHLLIFFYFFLSSILKTGLQNPFLLTMKFNSLYLSAYIGFTLMIGLFYLSYKLFTKRNFSFIPVIVLWSYSLWPTLYWFFATSLMYILIHPPRTLTLPGKIYSLSYLSLSLTLLLWKIILYYLTLRFGLRLGLFQISLISFFIISSLILYSFVMYYLGIFKIPFI